MVTISQGLYLSANNNILLMTTAKGRKASDNGVYDDAGFNGTGVVGKNLDGLDDGDKPDAFSFSAPQGSPVDSGCLRC